ncbi:hypothetical protein ACLOJK_012342 [Asimina triloba]
MDVGGEVKLTHKRLGESYVADKVREGRDYVGGLWSDKVREGRDYVGGLWSDKVREGEQLEVEEGVPTEKSGLPWTLEGPLESARCPLWQRQALEGENSMIEIGHTGYYVPRRCSVGRQEQMRSQSTEASIEGVSSWGRHKRLLRGH